MEELLSFLDRLEEARIAYDLKHIRDSVLVLVHVPQGYCEIEFLVDGSIEVEWFRRGEDVEAVDAAWLDGFIAEQRD